jgi:hypothetical protein
MQKDKVYDENGVELSSDEILERWSIPTVSRIEVIDNTGRSYVNWNVSEFKLFVQDDKRTLKLFIKDKDLG